MGSPSCSTCILMATVDAITFILGIIGNGAVIWIAGCKMKKSVNTIWYLNLAVSDFLFCLTMPFSFVYKVKLDWDFGSFICKLRFFITCLNMFSSVFLLVIISVDRCVIVKFPVWAQNKRNTTKASVIVLLVWIISVAISVPHGIFSDTVSFDNQTFCSLAPQYRRSMFILLSNFILGFLIPFLIISICYFIIIQKVIKQKSKKPLKVIIILISAFFICWMPYHTVSLVRNIGYNYIYIPSIIVALSRALIQANSFLNPFLYAFMGRDFKMQCKMPFSNIHSVIEG